MASMRIPPDAIIADAKLTEYLLVQRSWDDKSGYLRRAGFTLDNWIDLRRAIRGLSDSVDAVEDGIDEYGTIYTVDGALAGPIGELPVRLIWMEKKIDRRFHFITLKPRKE